MIQSIHLENFRNFEKADLCFDAKSVILCGANGQGKSSLLEAIFYLANLRSFRTGRVQEMRKIGTEQMHISSIMGEGNIKNRMELRLGVNERKLWMNGNPVRKASEFIGHCNTVAFLPDDPEIIVGASSVRRRFMDMFISMTDREYFVNLQRYASALKSRNVLIRSVQQDRHVLEAYHPVLAEFGSKIIERRFLYARILTDFMKQVLKEIRPELSDCEIKMRAVHELEDAEVYRKRLDASVQKDQEKGYTSFGPHLDDFDFICSGKSLRNYGSRGQCRVVSFALKMAGFDILNSCSRSPEKTIVMVDDATGDLDERAKNAFLDKI